MKMTDRGKNLVHGLGQAFTNLSHEAVKAETRLLK